MFMLYIERGEMPLNSIQHAFQQGKAAMLLFQSSLIEFSVKENCSGWSEFLICQPAFYFGWTFCWRYLGSPSQEQFDAEWGKWTTEHRTWTQEITCPCWWWRWMKERSSWASSSSYLGPPNLDSISCQYHVLQLTSPYYLERIPTNNCMQQALVSHAAFVCCAEGWKIWT